MIKILMFTAPVLCIVLIITLTKMSGQEAKMDVQTAYFDEEYAHEMSSFAKNAEEKAFWKQRKQQAQQQISSARAAEQEAQQLDRQQHKDMLDLKNDLDAIGKDLNRDDLRDDLLKGVKQ